MAPVRPRLSNDDIRRRAAELGHLVAVMPTKSGRRYTRSCSCGWTPVTTRATLRIALEDAMHHLWRVVHEDQHRGVS